LIKREIIEKINDLFIMPRYKYLIMNDKAEYMTLNTYQSKKVVTLNDSIVKRHLEHKATLGVFAGQYTSKFLTFDVDVKDKQLAKWTVYRLVNTLTEIGLSQDNIYISISGNKGYHVDLYFSEPIQNHLLHELYMITLNKSDLLNIDFGEVEYRPTNEQGVKIPLGINFKNNNKKTNVCWYCDFNKGLEPVKKMDYILNIEKIDSQIIYNILDKEHDNGIEEEKAVEVEETKGYIDSQYNALEIYKQNIDESVTIESIEELEQNGLTQTGMRHNSLFKLAKYYRYLGVTSEQCEEMLIDWMKKQDTRTYTTKWDDVVKDISQIVQYIYDNEITLTMKEEEIQVDYDEMVQIMKLKSKNEKLVAYAMLLHSKRYAMKNGIFYMSYNQMAKATGLVEKTIRNLVPKLEQDTIIDFVERNQMVKDKKGAFVTKKPNKYRLNISSQIENSKSFTVACNGLNYSDSFHTCLIYMFGKDRLKDILPRRQYESVIANSI